MILNNEALKNKKVWEEKGYRLPAYDREAMIAETLKHPTWVHFGGGNIFRGFLARLQQELLNQGLVKSGIIVGESYDYQIIEEVFTKQDNLTLGVTLKSDGSVDKEVIASVAAARPVEPTFPEDWALFKRTFANPSLQMVSFTITEKGYAIRSNDGSLFESIAKDIEKGAKAPKSFLAKLTSLLYHRYQQKGGNLTLVSMDNCAANGDRIAEAVKTIAKGWAERNHVEKAFLTYLDENVAYPWTMIDKITPRPDAKIVEILKKDGFKSGGLIVTDNNTHVSFFVNAEEAEYLVIEDTFKNGRPPLDKVGVYFTDRSTVNKVERMKVTTCLNPLHTALAVFGSILGFTLISEEMRDPQLRALVEGIGYIEGMPVVVDPGIIDPKQFIDEVLNKRFPNPFMPDTPQRIATDTSQKLAIRFGETIKSYLEHPDLDVNDLKLIPLVHAGWLRYLMGIDDEGKPFTPSSDPRLEEAQRYVKGIKLGDKGPFDQLDGLLKDKTIWGVDLIEVGLSALVLSYFEKLIKGPGAVRQTLIDIVGP
ncbi:MAG TPA: mannitol dehydrogenase family protein [Sphaerochaeta sp.]|jgi:fructuronate reductase|nr:mannitol dehydrogenase family protein [Sphaerochaeta sp.]